MKTIPKLLFFSFVLFIPFLTVGNQLLPSSSTSSPSLPSSYQMALTLDEVGIKLNITYAYYHDLDNDGFSDDILTVLRISTLSGVEEFMYTNLLQAITTPSGISYYFITTIIGYYASLDVIAFWYDTATESGWYTFTAAAESLSVGWYCQTYTTYSFDPPDEGPEGGMPRVDLFIG